MRFSYESNIQRFWGDGKSGDADTLSLITGSIRQSHAYFLAGAKAPMDIAPLLFYYGFTNLLWGVAALLGAERLPIKSHGMRLIAPVANASTASTYSQKLENWNVRPASWNDGGLHLLCKVFSDGCVFPSTSTVEGENDWNLGELFGSFLDLRDDVFACYGSDRIYAVPIEIVRHQGILFDRVTLEDMNPGTSYQEQIQVFSLVEKFRSAYLMPQSSDGSHVVLKPKLGGVDIVSYSLFGNRFLALSHLKSNNLVCPSPIITLLMTLFALGYLSRYHPEIWNRFVRNDESGERMIVETLPVFGLPFRPKFGSQPSNG